MFTTDLALKFDPAYKPIAKRFQENPKEFQRAFAKAWFKLTHRDMGPRSRYLGRVLPQEGLSWQDPVPAVDHALVSAADVAALKASVLASDLSASDLVRTAWASASTFRDTDMRGGANGARIRLAPQAGWAVNEPKELARVLAGLERIQREFNAAQSAGRSISLADLIVLGGSAAIEQAAKKAGHDVQVPFTPGRMDATQEMTDVSSFAVLEPTADGFRNYLAPDHPRSASALLIDKADMLGLTVPEMTVLIGGLRVLDVNVGRSRHGVLTDRPGALTNDFFVNLLDMSSSWRPSTTADGVYEGLDRRTGKLKWTATEVDLIFGSNAELRAVAEVHAFDSSQENFLRDFVAAWTKIMNADRFDLRSTTHPAARPARG
jgi:catalase-peroxidase